MASDKGYASREIIGVGSIIDTHHEGQVKRPSETQAIENVDKNSSSSKKRLKKSETPMKNPNYIKP